MTLLQRNAKNGLQTVSATVNKAWSKTCQILCSVSLARLHLLTRPCKLQAAGWRDMPSSASRFGTHLSVSLSKTQSILSNFEMAKRRSCLTSSLSQHLPGKLKMQLAKPVKLQGAVFHSLLQLLSRDKVHFKSLPGDVAEKRVKIASTRLAHSRFKCKILAPSVCVAGLGKSL